MVRSHYFDHTSPGGSTLVTRARATGYVRPTLAFSLGENIGWGEGTFATPRAIVRAWMASPEHRRNILFPRFRDVGFGLAAGTPQGTAGATFTTDFGVRG
jgi:uncharacterized protein YkwD